jgi:hypothetical protein
MDGLAEEANVDVMSDGSNNEMNKIAEVVEQKKEVVTNLKEQVVNMANSELQAPNITASEVENINMIKEDAVMVAKAAADILASGMEAAEALFS